MLFLFVTLYTRYFPRLERTGADIYPFRLAIYENSHLLNVDAPSALVSIVCMGNMVPCAGRFAGNKTFTGHAGHLLYQAFQKQGH